MFRLLRALFRFLVLMLGAYLVSLLVSAVLRRQMSRRSGPERFRGQTGREGREAEFTVLATEPRGGNGSRPHPSMVPVPAEERSTPAGERPMSPGEGRPDHADAAGASPESAEDAVGSATAERRSV